MYLSTEHVGYYEKQWVHYIWIVPSVGRELGFEADRSLNFSKMSIMNDTNETGRLIEKYLPVDYHDTFSVQTDVNGLSPAEIITKNILV